MGNIASTVMNLCTVLHSVQFALALSPSASSTLSDELSLCIQLLLPSLECMLFLCRIRRDLFEKYTPLFNPMVRVCVRGYP